MNKLYLEFAVRGQEIKRIDSHKLYSGSKNFVKAKYTFDDYWSGVNKYAQYTTGDTTYTTDIIDGVSDVPWEVLQNACSFSVSVFAGDLITANTALIYVGESGLRDGQLPAEPTPGYFDTVVADRVRAEQAKTDAEAAKAAAEDARDAAGNNAEIAESAAQAASSEADRASNKADEAEQSETVTTQTMQDLLNMMGTDIATLTGGKLTPTQIPAVAIAEPNPVSTRAEMLALDAQSGDIAIVTQDDDGYSRVYSLKKNGDPSVFEDWLPLSLPNTYVTEAGHAVTADNAVNADRINNKRIVGMTQSQYDNAALDEDTIYIVTPDEV